jgi:CRP-like cAMP-binding protein
MKRGDLLVVQGDPSAYVFFIEQGSVLAFRCSETGKEVALSYLGSGDACGLEDGISGQPYGCTHQALTPGIVWCVLASHLRVAIRDFPTLAQVVIGYMADRLRSAVEHIELVTLEDLSTRVRRMLTLCAGNAEVSNGSMRLPLTQSQLAALVGASRQRTNAALSGLHQMGIVDSQGKGILIRDPSALRTS